MSHPYLDYFDKTYPQYLKGKFADYRRIFEGILAKRKNNLVFVVIGTCSEDQDGNPIHSIVKILDQFLNLKGVDGQLIVADIHQHNFDDLAAKTSNKTTLVQDDITSVLQSLASNVDKEIDLLFIGDEEEELESKGTIAKKTMKLLPILDETLSENSLLVLDCNQKNSNMGREIMGFAIDEEKKPFVNGAIVGWVW